MKKQSIFFVLFVSAALFATTAFSQTKGENVNYVQYPNGNFKQTSNQTWTETDPNRNNHIFTETGRDEWSVYMIDRSRDITIQLDLYMKEIYIYYDRPNRRVLYKITKTSSAPRKSAAMQKNKSALPGYKKGPAEGGTMYFKNYVDVAYGADGEYVYKKKVKGSIKFDNATFGRDPAPGKRKSGYYRSSKYK